MHTNWITENDFGTKTLSLFYPLPPLSLYDLYIPSTCPLSSKKHKYIHFQIYRSMNIPLFSMIISHSLSSPSITNCSVLSRSFWPVYAHTYSDTDDPHGHLFFQNARKHTFIQIPSL